MPGLHRNLKVSAEADYDLIIIGGGIYGVTLALESARIGLKSLLLEKGLREKAEEIRKTFDDPFEVIEEAML